MGPVDPAEASEIQYNRHHRAEMLQGDDVQSIHKEGMNAQDQLCPDDASRVFLGARVMADDLLDLIFH